MLFLDTFRMGDIHSGVGKVSGGVVRLNTVDKLYGATGGGVPEPRIPRPWSAFELENSVFSLHILHPSHGF